MNTKKWKAIKRDNQAEEGRKDIKKYKDNKGT
jgi:hypothetical protein